ncbi:MAG TPA: S9 family peptidase [Flavisolibacter sp.]|jgi:dipeptidyl aminopeptidase/acylaminoacyl peptidase|nr:S9 family peptidase [Flavisolibacter sp.]
MIVEQTIEKKFLAIEDLNEVAAVSAPAISADGQWLAYVTTKVVLEENCYKDFISVLDLQTKQEVLEWEGSTPQWSPVSNEIAFLAEYNGVNYIWLYSMNSGIKKPLAPLYESHYFMGHLALKNFAWSPDGLSIAYISAESSVTAAKEESNVRVIDRLAYKTKGGRGRPVVTDNALSHIWTVAVEGGVPQVVTTGIYNEHSLAWSPDISKIAFVSNRSDNPDNNQLYDLWAVDLSTKIVTRITEEFGTVHQPSWSPDGKWIAFLGTLSKMATNDSPAEDTHLYLVSPDGSSVQCLTKQFDRRIEQISWHPESDTIYFTAGDKGTTALYKITVSTGSIEKVFGQKCHVLSYAVNKSGNRICYASMDSTHPSEIFLYDEQSQLSQQLTAKSAPLLQKCSLQPAETFWFKSHDNLDIQAWIMKPAERRSQETYPLILVIHGGPHNMFGYDFEERMQILAANGYGVLYINSRGSHGYGQFFSSGCVLNWGGNDYKDLMAGVEAALEKHNWIDASRLGVTGQSYGGYMGNWIITQTNRFKAAVVDGGISNLVSFAGTSLYHSLIEAEFNGSAYDNFDLLWQWSPLRHVKNVSTPTLFLHGEVDNEVPLSQAEEMYIALKKLGVESQFVQYVGEGHGWRPDLLPKNRYDVLKRMLAWFDRHVKGNSDQA